MAPLAMAVMSMVGSAGAAAAAGASTLAGTVSSALAGSATALSSLQSGFSIASAFGTIAGGIVEDQEYQLQARSERLQAEREALAIKDETLKKIGDSRVAFGASGVTLASASPVDNTLYGQSDREMALARSAGRLKANQARIRGKASLISSVTNAAGQLGNSATSIANRGV